MVLALALSHRKPKSSGLHPRSESEGTPESANRTFARAWASPLIDRGQSERVLVVRVQESDKLLQAMKRLLLRSFAVALLLAPCSGFATYMVGLRRITEYKPPLSGAELRSMDNLTLKQFEAVTTKRTVSITRTQWLAQSIGSAYFWHDVASRSIVPFAAVFVGCVCIGALERRTLIRLAGTASATSFERETPK
jgi:hypothetical protein